MTQILLSIRPNYVQAIIDGQKKYEFRRSIFRQKDVDRVYMYSSSPVKKIVGSFDISDIVEGSPQDLWSRFARWSGMNAENFFHYFSGKSRGFAIGIDRVNVFSNPVDPRAHFEGFVPPQSFCYFNDSIENVVTGRAARATSEMKVA